MYTFCINFKKINFFRTLQKKKTYFPWKKQYIWKEEQKALENTVNLKLWFRWNRQCITPKPQREANFPPPPKRKISRWPFWGRRDSRHPCFSLLTPWPNQARKSEGLAILKNHMGNGCYQDHSTRTHPEGTKTVSIKHRTSKKMPDFQGENCCLFCVLVDSTKMFQRQKTQPPCPTRAQCSILISKKQIKPR